MIRLFLAIFSLIFVVGCTESASRNARGSILLMGDSMMAWNGTEQGGVASSIERNLGRRVLDRSVSGARYLLPPNFAVASALYIPSQYVYNDWDYVVLNGGGNDLLFGCGCSNCAGVLRRLISTDGTRGIIPRYVSELQLNGAHVIYVGYLRNPGTQTPVKHCKAASDELDRRLTLLAQRDPKMTFLPMSDVVPHGDPTYHAADRIHPSEKGSYAIGRKVSNFITQHSGR